MIRKKGGLTLKLPPKNPGFSFVVKKTPDHGVGST